MGRKGSGPGRTQQNLMDLAEYGRMPQIAVRLPLDCRRLLLGCRLAVSL